MYLEVNLTELVGLESFSMKQKVFQENASAVRNEMTHSTSCMKRVNSSTDRLRCSGFI